MDETPSANRLPPSAALGDTPAKGTPDTREVLTDLAPGESRAYPDIPGYEVLGTCGHGGMGVVYRARQLKANRLVALKMIRAVENANPTERLRFQIEAEAVARLQHPHIVQLYEVGEVRGQPFFSLEFCDGGTLTDQLKKQRPTPHEAATLIETLARAMHYAHLRGVVHRDLKPGNVLLAGAERVAKITDFGLAKRIDAEAREVSQSGAIMGTASYMAPEQAAGKVRDTGPAADVYTMGALLYECLTGRPPFEGPQHQVLLSVLSDEPAPPSKLAPRIPRDLETICLKCLSKEPARRYASAEELANDLRRFQAGEPIRARPVGMVERVAKWVRRRPAVTGLLGSSTLAALALVVAIVGSFYSSRLEAERDTAEGARARAEQANRGEEEQRRKAETFLYFSRIALAEREWTANNVGRTGQLLNECPVALRGWEWDYLQRLCHADLRTLRGHGQAVGSVAFSPDGQRLATVGFDKTLIIWDAATGAKITTTPVPEVGTSLAFSPRGERLAMGSWVADETQPVALSLLDSSTLRPQALLPGPVGWTSDVAFDPAGLKLASANNDGTVLVWEVASRRLLQTFRTDLAPFSATAFRPPDGRVLAGAIGDWGDWADATVGLILLWDVATGKTLQTLSGHENGVLTVAFRPDGQQLASAGRDQTIRIWDPATGKELRTLRGHTDRVSRVAYDPKGTRLASASYDGSVRIWDPASGRLLRNLRGHTGPVNWLAFNPAGDRLASVGSDGTVKVWDPTLDPDSRTLRLHAKAALGVAFSPDGARLAVCGSDGMLKVFETSTGQVLHTSTGHSDRVWSVEFSSGGDRLVSAGRDRTARIWDAATGQELVCLSGHTKWAQNATFSPDGQLVATASGDYTVKLWDARTGREFHTLKGHTDRVNSVVFFPDGTRLVSCSSDKSVRVWDVESGKQLHSFPGHTDEVFRVAVNRDGSLLASAGSDLSVRIWGPATGQSKLELKGHTGYVMGLSFSPDGQRLASASLDQTVKVWDLTLGQELLTLRADTGGFHCVAFSPGGKQLAACGYDGSVRIWDATPVVPGGVK
jgi:WD40 repeat protein/tRNA A-37 threonylcarbamoyl transferase component Bud32